MMLFFQVCCTNDEGFIKFLKIIAANAILTIGVLNTHLKKTCLRDVRIIHDY